MNNKKIMVLIGVMLLIFVLIKVIADQLCSASPTNAVSAAVSDVISMRLPVKPLADLTPCRGSLLVGKFCNFSQKPVIVRRLINAVKVGTWNDCYLL